MYISIACEEHSAHRGALRAPERECRVLDTCQHGECVFSEQRDDLRFSEIAGGDAEHTALPREVSHRCNVVRSEIDLVQTYRIEGTLVQHHIVALLHRVVHNVEHRVLDRALLFLGNTTRQVYRLLRIVHARQCCEAALGEL